MVNPVFRGVVAAAAMLASSIALSMVPLEDDQMSDVSGAGLAFALENFRFEAAPTSYIEQVGGPPGAGTTFNRGDLRWFGVTMSGTAGGQTWSGTCGAGLQNLGCPIGSGGIANYANHDNPFVLRAFDYQRVGLNGANTWVGAPVSGGVSANGVVRTVLELIGPSNAGNFRWAFWGEIEASTDDGAGNVNSLGVLQNQNLILGRPVTHLRPTSIFGTNTGTNALDGPLLQLFQFRGERLDNGGTPFIDETLGILYHSRLQGDYRFSVAQQGVGPDANGVPRFNNVEGLYFKNVNAFLPLGQLHYQALVLDDLSPGSSNPGVAGSGDFVLQVTRIPNNANVYNDFYSSAGDRGYRRYGRNDRYYQTHGFVEWGSAFPTCAGGGANGSTQCMSGTGVSGIRYNSNGTDIDGATRTINQTNFPGHASCGADVCRWSGQTVGNVLNSGWNNTQITGVGGMSIVSSASGSTWTVPNNQNQATNNNLTRVIQYDEGCGFFCTNTVRELQRNPSYNPTITMRAINLGASRVVGMSVQHLKITTLGVAN